MIGEQWAKSTFSHTNGCVEARWVKATASGLNGCVEVAFDDLPTSLHNPHVQVRNSRDPGGPILTFTAHEWVAFIKGARRGEFNIWPASCSERGCEQPVKARGYCTGHYQQFMAEGRIRRITPAERFWAKVNQDGPVPQRRPDLGGCWLWQGAHNGRDYGRFSIDGRHVYAYRFAYELLVEPIPEGQHLDHLCGVRECVRPSHLEPVTQAENNRRAVAIRKSYLDLPQAART